MPTRARWFILIWLPLSYGFVGFALGRILMFFLELIVGPGRLPVLVWILFSVGGLGFGLWLALRVVAKLKANPNTCQQCGYEMTGNAGGVCPECGTKT